MADAQEWLHEDEGMTDHLRPMEEEEENEVGAGLASEAAEGGGSGGELPFSKQLISFSLFGRLSPKSSKWLAHLLYSHLVPLFFFFQ